MDSYIKMHCEKCQRETGTRAFRDVISKNKRLVIGGVCAERGRTKT